MAKLANSITEETIPEAQQTEEHEEQETQAATEQMEE